jgi:hypothetical protein
MRPSSKASHTAPQDSARRWLADVLRSYIAVLQTLSDELRCDDVIAVMKEQIARLEQPPLTLVVNHDID